jgi:hypothetical protein
MTAGTPRGTNGNGKHEQSMAFQPTDIGRVGMCIRLPCLAPSDLRAAEEQTSPKRRLGANRRH